MEVAAGIDRATVVVPPIHMFLLLLHTLYKYSISHVADRWLLYNHFLAAEK